MYLYTCVRVYVCTCVRVYVCTCVRVYVCTCVRVYVCTCVRVYVCTCVRVYVCTCVRVYVCTCVRVYVCTCVRVYVCTVFAGLCIPGYPRYPVPMGYFGDPQGDLRPGTPTLVDFLHLNLKKSLLSPSRPGLDVKSHPGTLLWHSSWNSMKV